MISVVGKYISLFALLIAVALAALISGAFPIGPAEGLMALVSPNTASIDARDVYVVRELRLPRLIGALVIGALLGGSGMVMQGLFRNPLADPGLIGVSSGAALFAVGALFFGLSTASAFLGIPIHFVLPVLAFTGALVAATLALRLSLVSGRAVMSILLLVGICIQFFGGALTSLFVFASDDESLRSITFWLMGGFAGISSDMLPVILIVGAPALAVLWRHHSEIDLLALGEVQAEATGVDVKRIRKRMVLVAAIAVGLSVAFSGVVGFIGLAAPHLARLIFGARHRLSLPGAMLLGALLAASSDLLARLIVLPKELPVGIVTAFLGTPFMLFLLLKLRRKMGFAA